MSDKNKGGRPSKFSDEVIQQILSDIESGLSRSEVARRHNIDRGTLNNWLKRPEVAEKLGGGNPVPEPMTPEEQERNDAVLGELTFEPAPVPAWEMSAIDLVRGWIQSGDMQTGKNK
jgi:transposase-like protein